MLVQWGPFQSMAGVLCMHDTYGDQLETRLLLRDSTVDQGNLISNRWPVARGLGSMY